MLDLSSLRYGFAFLISLALYPVTVLGFWLNELRERRRYSVADFIVSFGLDIVLLICWSVALVIALARL